MSDCLRYDTVTWTDCLIIPSLCHDNVMMTLCVMLQSCQGVITTSRPADDAQPDSININNGLVTRTLEWYSQKASVGGPTNDFSPHLKMDWKLKMIRWPRGRGHNSHEEQTFQNPLKPAQPEILPIHVSLPLSKCYIGPIWKFWNVFSIATYF